jgi:hypothetical protein
MTSLFLEYETHRNIVGKKFYWANDGGKQIFEHVNTNEIVVTKVYKKYSTSTYYSVDYVYNDGLKGSEYLDTFLQIASPVDGL